MGNPCLNEDEKILAEAVVSSTKSVFQSMVGIEVEHQTTEGSKTVTRSSEVISLISFTGNYVGTLSTFFNAKGALKAASNMMGMECASITDEEVQDVIGEITNMVAGNVKTSIVKTHGELHLSIPMVICGEGLTITSTSTPPSKIGFTSSVTFQNKESWLLVHFKIGNEMFTIGILIKKLGN